MVGAFCENHYTCRWAQSRRSPPAPPPPPTPQRGGFSSLAPLGRFMAALSSAMQPGRGFCSCHCHLSLRISPKSTFPRGGPSAQRLEGRPTQPPGGHQARGWHSHCPQPTRTREYEIFRKSPPPRLPLSPPHPCPASSLGPPTFSLAAVLSFRCPLLPLLVLLSFASSVPFQVLLFHSVSPTPSLSTSTWPMPPSSMHS